jgi:hypothetical protein
MLPRMRTSDTRERKRYCGIALLAALTFLLLTGCDLQVGPAFPERDGRAFLEEHGYEPGLIQDVIDRKPLTSATVLELSRSASTDVRFLVAGNPHLTEDEIDLFMGDNNDFVRSGAAANPGLSDEQIDRLIRDRSHTVHAKLAANPAFPEEVLLRIHHECDPGLLWFAMNPNCPELLRQAIEVSDDDLAKHWLRETQKEKVAR